MSVPCKWDGGYDEGVNRCNCDEYIDACLEEYGKDLDDVIVDLYMMLDNIDTISECPFSTWGFAKCGCKYYEGDFDDE